MNPKILGTKSSTCAQQLLIAADYVNCKIDFQEPTVAGACTSVVTSEGSPLWDVQSGLRYFARMRPDVGLYGRTFDEAAQIDSFLYFFRSAVMVPLIAWRTWIKNQEGACVQKIKSDISDALTKRVESQLLKQTFIVGERISIADIHLALLLNSIVSLDSEILASFPNTQRWLNTMLGQTLVKKHIAGASAPAKKDNKKEQPKKVEAKKEKSAADIEEEIEAEEKAARKKANPLDSLPATSMVMDAWKREYSNTKDLRGVAMTWFWKNFDAAGYSLWFMKYEKVEGENTVGFTTANMLGGFLQRLDGNFRKYSFGVINVLGKEGDFDIQGVWLMRGQEIPFELKDHPSFEYNTFRKLDHVSDKALIEDYWCNDESIDGRPIDSCKVWK